MTQLSSVNLLLIREMQFALFITYEYIHIKSHPQKVSHDENIHKIV